MNQVQIFSLLYLIATILVGGFVLIMIYRFVKAVEKIAAKYSEKE